MRSDCDSALTLEGVSKRFLVTQTHPWRASEALMHPMSFVREVLFGEPFWALHDINLSVIKGEFLGILGQNGSGKSTMLRVMAGLSLPTTGTVTAHGRIASLLDLGAGFHPRATGRENAFINGLLMGLSKQEIRAKIPEIIRFAELEEFADRPMRTYSAGMTLRLSFAVAVHVRPDVFLIDEVLAVGDADFQEKCFAHFEALKRDGVTMVLVSHDMSAIERFSDRVVLVEHGRIVATGEPRAMVSQYLTELAERSPAARQALERALLRAWAAWQETDRLNAEPSAGQAGTSREQEGRAQ
jgi:ABC-type polysaccharide/polyol phosphate transport system ATPase subunit